MWGGILKAQTVKPVAEYDNGVLTPSTFLQTNILSPLTTGIRTRFEVGKNFPNYTVRSIYYGGNLGVSQSTSLYGDALGKWSFMGAWKNHLGTNTTQNPGPYFVNGINYLVNYHRWGNYSASFGLKERVTDIGFYQFEPPAPSAQQKIKDAVITWSYEQGTIDPHKSRLIFQSIEGVDKTVTPTAHTVTEHATMLYNGNFGLGTSTPVSHFDIRPSGLNNNQMALTVSDANGDLRFCVKEFGTVEINSNGYSSALDVEGNVLFDGDYFSAKCSTKFQNPAGATATTKIISINDQTGTDLFNITDEGRVFFPKLNPLVNNTGSVKNLVIDTNGEIKAEIANNSVLWKINGNWMPSTHSGTDLTIGTNTTLNDINFKVGNDVYAKVHGKGGTNNGYMEYRKPVAMGGYSGKYAIADPFFALSLISPINEHHSDYTSSGMINCMNVDSTEVFGVRTGSINLLNGAFAFHGFAEFQKPLIMNDNIELNGNIVYPHDTLHAFNIGAPDHAVHKIYSFQYMPNTSDRRAKNNIYSLKSELENIMKIRPVSYRLNRDKENKTQFGFIAQELIKIYPQAVEKPIDSTGKYYITYTTMIPILTKGIQELNIKIEDLKTKGIKQRNTIEKLQLEVDANKQCCNGGETRKPSFGSAANTDNKIKAEAYLLQNIPNPFDGTVYIPCYIPEKEAMASLRITDDNGKLVYEQAISQRGNCTLKLDDLNITEGKYFYYLLINNTMVDAKIMLKK